MIITNYYTDGYHANGEYKWLRPPLNFLCRWSQAREEGGTSQYGFVWRVVNELVFFDNWHVVVCKSGNWPGLSFIPQQAIILAGSHINYSFYTCLTLYCYSVHPEINVHILHTVLCTFPKVETRRICLTIKSFFNKLVIISFILMTLMCGSGWYFKEKLNVRLSHL